MELKLFTVEEANDLLPRLRVLLGELSAIRQRWNTIYTGETVESVMDGKPPETPISWLESHDVHQDELEELKEEFYNHISEIHNMGCQVKDIPDGLIDFPCMRDDKIVLLCWKLGETSIKYWHGMEGGFSSRQPL
jgi:hypothetical protein